jgi:ankyrin repeat protein
MYPNPQDALPLPAEPNIEQYKKLAKELVKARGAQDPTAVEKWAGRWVETLARLHREPDAFRGAKDIRERAEQLARYAQTRRATLTDAQFVIARAHGFLSWPKFVKHLEGMSQTRGGVWAFEAAAKAIVRGELDSVRELLRKHPELVRARSMREHRATLLHYVSANGVEHYRQVSPKNIVEIAEVLLAAGADVDAGASVYRGDCTTLGLVATSEPPARAGVQIDLIELLLRHGARMDLPGSAGNRHTLVWACLANGQGAAAKYVAARGAALDLASAAGVGNLDVVKEQFDRDDGRKADGFSMACGYGRTEVVEYFLEHGMPVDTELKGHGEGHTGLHVAAYHGHIAVVEALLRHGARVDAIDKTWGTPPLLWALAGWDRESGGRDERYYDVVARLVAAGAKVDSKLLAWEKVRADPRMLMVLS